MKILNLSVSPACITLTEKYTNQLLFITYASLFDNLIAQILDNTTPTRSCRHILIITEQTEIVCYRYYFEFVPYHPYVCFYQDFCNERPHSLFFAHISNFNFSTTALRLLPFLVYFRPQNKLHFKHA